MGYIVSLAAVFWLVPPAEASYGVVAPMMAAAALMLFFGPYLLVAGCTTGFLPSVYALWGLAAIVPFYIAHVAFIAVMSRKTSLWRRIGRRGESVRKAVVALFAVMSALGVWFEIPKVTEYDLPAAAAKVPEDGLRLAVVTDLHSCRYAAGQRALAEAVRAQSPDAVFLVGDIFDDRLPDDDARAFVAAVVKDFPCFYVFGNHEHWSERTHEMRDFLESSGVTVLSGATSTIFVRDTAIDVCGVDDPTYMDGSAWLAQFSRVDASANPAHLRLLLSHRTEYAAEYAKTGFDFVFSGHLHGGQWTIPLLELGVCGPSSGGPGTGERMFLLRHVGGAYPLDNGKTTLVVSRGLARESTPLPRFFNHPELVVVNLRPQIDVENF